MSNPFSAPKKRKKLEAETTSTLTKTASNFEPSHNTVWNSEDSKTEELQNHHQLSAPELDQFAEEPLEEATSTNEQTLFEKTLNSEESPELFEEEAPELFEEQEDTEFEEALVESEETPEINADRSPFETAASDEFPAEQPGNEVDSFTETTEANEEELNDDEMLFVDENGVEPVTVEITDNLNSEDTLLPLTEEDSITETAVAAHGAFGAPLEETSTTSESEFESENEALPVLTMDEHSCRACKHFYFGKSACRGTAVSGECRRNAPSPGNKKAEWPTVSWDNWCGEFEGGMTAEDMAHMAKAITDSIEEDGGMTF